MESFKFKNLNGTIENASTQTLVLLGLFAAFGAAALGSAGDLIGYLQAALVIVAAGLWAWMTTRHDA